MAWDILVHLLKFFHAKNDTVMSGIVTTRMKHLGRWMVLYAAFVLVAMIFELSSLFDIMASNNWDWSNLHTGVAVQILGLLISGPILILYLSVGSTFCAFFESVIDDCQDPELCMMKIEVNLADC
jgi:hypothetical protein